MRDPFQPSNNAQLVREAQIGLSLIAILLILFVYVAFFKISSRGRGIPEHVRRAPIAETVWPNEAQTPAIESTERTLTANSLINLLFNSVPAEKYPTPLPQNPVESLVLNPPEPDFNTQPPLNQVQNQTAAISQANFDEDEMNGFELPTQSEFARTVKPLQTRPSNQIQTSGNSFSEVANERVPINTTLPNAVAQNIVTTSVEVLEQPQPFQPVSHSSETEKTELNSEPNIERETDNSFVAVHTAVGTPNLIAPRPAVKTNKFETERQTKALPPLTKPTIAQTQSIDAEPTIQEKSWPESPATVEPSTSKTTHIAPKSIQPRLPIDHIVQPSESFWTIAQIYYDGDGSRFRELFEYNRNRVNHYDLEPGMVLVIPPLELLLSPASFSDTHTPDASDSANIYRTQTGDTLFEISRQRLGQASRYLEILRRNAEILPANVDHLSPLPANLRLVLPE